MKVSFLSPDNKELVILPADYVDDVYNLKAALLDFLLYKEGKYRYEDILLLLKYKDWKIFISIPHSYCNIVSSTPDSRGETIEQLLSYVEENYKRDF